jgi:hypothetical protein
VTPYQLDGVDSVSTGEASSTTGTVFVSSDDYSTTRAPSDLQLRISVFDDTWGPGASLSSAALEDIPSRPEWIERFDSELQKFAKLRHGWDGVNAAPPNRVAIQNAALVLSELATVRRRPNRIAPSVEEGVVIWLMGNNGHANIECFNSGDILAAVSVHGAPPDLWELDRAEVQETLDRIDRMLASGASISPVAYATAAAGY